MRQLLGGDAQVQDLVWRSGMQSGSPQDLVWRPGTGRSYVTPILSQGDPLATLGRKRKLVWGEESPMVNFSGRTGAITEYLNARAREIGVSGDDLATAYNLIQNLLLMGESGYGTKQTTNKSTGKGPFMILNGTFDTIKGAPRSYMGRYGAQMDGFFNRLSSARSVFDLNPYDQATLSLLASDFPGARRRKANVYYRNMTNAIRNNDVNALKQNMLNFVIDNYWAGGNHPHRNATIRHYTRKINELINHVQRGGTFR